MDKCELCGTDTRSTNSYGIEVCPECYDIHKKKEETEEENE